MQAILESARIYSIDLLDVANYDRMWPHFYQQIRGYDAVSLVYYGDAQFKDFVGVRTISKNFDPATGKAISATYGVDLMDEGRLQRLPSRCPLTCPANIAANLQNQTRFKYNLNDAGRITGDAYEVATFDPTSRTWYTSAVGTSGSSPIWTDVYVFSNRIDIGITAAIQVFSRSEPNRVQGVLGSDMSFGVLKDQLRLLPLTRNGFALVFDDAGNLYGSSVDKEAVTSVDPATSATTIKSVRNLVDPTSRIAMDHILSGLPNQGLVDNGRLSLSSLPPNGTFTVPLPGSTAVNSDLVLLLKRVDMGYGLNVFLLIGAPLSDYTGGIDATSVELRDRLNANTRLMLIIGAGAVLAFVVLSIPVTHFTIAKPLKTLSRHMEEVAKFDFGSLHATDRNKRSFIRELGVIQTAYWNM
ncbi:hypothetical protein HDU67_001414 [Dinochytrium kinnereticum]|nr:hypothetical protein HDU67_001414 [Dinochytrium kinnereticum]